MPVFVCLDALALKSATDRAGNRCCRAQSVQICTALSHSDSRLGQARLASVYLFASLNQPSDCAPCTAVLDSQFCQAFSNSALRSSRDSVNYIHQSACCPSLLIIIIIILTYGTSSSQFTSDFKKVSALRWQIGDHNNFVAERQHCLHSTLSSLKNLDS